MTNQPKAPEPAPTLGLSADEVLTTTRAVRKRLDLTRPVPRSVIDDCMKIALQAPSGRNRQHWDFIFIEEPCRLYFNSVSHGQPARYSIRPGIAQIRRLSAESASPNQAVVG